MYGGNSLCCSSPTYIIDSISLHYPLFTKSTPHPYPISTVVTHSFYLAKLSSFNTCSSFIIFTPSTIPHFLLLQPLTTHFHPPHTLRVYPDTTTPQFLYFPNNFSLLKLYSYVTPLFQESGFCSSSFSRTLTHTNF